MLVNKVNLCVNLKEGVKLARGGLSTAEKLASKNPAQRREGQRELGQQTSTQQESTVTRARRISRSGATGVVTQRQVEHETKPVVAITKVAEDIEGLKGKELQREIFRRADELKETHGISRVSSIQFLSGKAVSLEQEQQLEEEFPGAEFKPGETVRRTQTIKATGEFGEKEFELPPEQVTLLDVVLPEIEEQKGVFQGEIRAAPTQPGIGVSLLAGTAKGGFFGGITEALESIPPVAFQKAKELSFQRQFRIPESDPLKQQAFAFGAVGLAAAGTAVFAATHPLEFTKGVFYDFPKAIITKPRETLTAIYETARIEPEIFVGEILATAGIAKAIGVAARPVTKKIGRAVTEKLTKVEFEGPGKIQQKTTTIRALGKIVVSKTDVLLKVEKARLFKEIEIPVPKFVKRGPIKIRFGKKTLKDIVVKTELVGVKDIDIGVEAGFKKTTPKGLKEFVSTGRAGGVISGEKGAFMFELFVKQKGKKFAAVTRGATAFEAKVVGKTESLFAERFEPIHQQFIGEIGGFRIQTVTKTQQAIFGKIGKIKQFPTRIGTFPALLKEQLLKKGTFTTGLDVGKFKIARETPLIRPIGKGVSVPVPESFREISTRLGLVSEFTGTPKPKTRKGLEKIFMDFIPTEKKAQIGQLLGLDVGGLVPPVTVKIPPARLKTPSQLSQFGAGAFTKVIGKEAIKLSEFIQPKIRGRITPVAVAIGASSKEILKPDIKSILKPSLKSILKPALQPALQPALLPALKPILKPALKPALKVALKPALKTILRTTLRTQPPTPTVLLTPPTTPTPFLFPLPQLEAFKYKKQAQLKTQFQFTPSLVALEEKLFGARPSFLTGIEVRKILR